MSLQLLHFHKKTLVEVPLHLFLGTLGAGMLVSVEFLLWKSLPVFTTLWLSAILLTNPTSSRNSHTHPVLLWANIVLKVSYSAYCWCWVSNDHALIFSRSLLGESVHLLLFFLLLLSFSSCALVVGSHMQASIFPLWRTLSWTWILSRLLTSKLTSKDLQWVSLNGKPLFVMLLRQSLISIHFRKGCASWTLFLGKSKSGI